MANDNLEKMTQEAKRATWQYRAIEATQAHTSKLGCIVLACLGHDRTSAGRLLLPRYGRACTIGADGLVRAEAWSVQGVHATEAVVAPIDEILNNFNRLADHLKFSDGERIALFEAFRRWVFRDERVKPEYTL